MNNDTIAQMSLTNTEYLIDLLEARRSLLHTFNVEEEELAQLVASRTRELATIESTLADIYSHLDTFPA